MPYYQNQGVGNQTFVNLLGMESQPKEFDLIESYLQESLSKTDRLAFEKRLAEDPDFAEEFSLHKQGRQLIQLSGREALMQRLDSRFESAKQQEGKVIPLYQRRSLQVAAAVLLIIVAGFWVMNNLNSSSPEQLFANYMENPKTSEVRDVFVPEQQSAWNKAISAFEGEDFAQATPILETLLEDLEFVKQSGGQASLYLGISYLNLGEPSKAIEAFSGASSSSIYFDQIQWYRALAHLKANQLEEAKTALQQIVDTPSHYKQTQAKELLEKI